NHHPTVVPMGTFPASDGVFNLAPGTNAHFRALCGVLDHPDWADDERYARPGSRLKRRQEVNDMIAEVTATRPANHWIDACQAVGVPAGPVLDLAEVFAHPQVQALGLAQPVEHPTFDDAAVVGQPVTFSDGLGDRGVRAPAPALGQNTDAILAELGRSPADIEALHADGIV
ncbi:MAG: CoA transferase, partial [Actinomycetia bacterium]|nr:CoA transferase [Actinomycetes bacterium]